LLALEAGGRRVFGIVGATNVANDAKEFRTTPSDTCRVGYNPYRRFRARPLDYVLVAACLLVAVALLVWAVAG
jgi:hypothetical protein